MMRSLYSGVAGLKTHQTRMDVIGNNIANVNTTAFKASSMTFNELMSQTTQKASGPNATTGTGGVNARQIGLGVKSGAININITGQGASQSTGNPFDIMITGDNFFVVNNGQQNFFTRDGSFYVDGAGNLAMTSTGYNVMGWKVDPDTGKIKEDNVTALRIMSEANMTYPPEATSLAYMAGILDSDDPDANGPSGKGVNLSFYDARGYDYVAKFVFKKSNEDGVFSLELSKITDSTGQPLDLSEATEALFGAETTQEKNGKVSFDATNYTWDNTGVLSRNGKNVADVKQLFAAGSTATNIVFEEGDTEITLPDGTKTTVQAAIDEIAKAYGYEGSTEDFLNLLYAAPNSATDPDQGTTKLSMKQLLFNLRNDPTNAAVGENTALPTFNGVAADQASFEVMGRLFEGVNVTFDKNTGLFSGINGAATNTSVTMKMSALGGNFSDIEIDFSEMVNYGNKGVSTASATSGSNKDENLGQGAGRRVGKMIGVSVSQNGEIYAAYSNSMTKLLGQIATAAFANASGLEKSGDNLYSATLNSGEFDGVGVDITAGGGYMSSGQLEMSNVDLSAEFTEMITTQRGFQANSRIITVSDTLLEELTNLKR